MRESSLNMLITDYPVSGSYGSIYHFSKEHLFMLELTENPFFENTISINGIFFEILVFLWALFKLTIND